MDSGFVILDSNAEDERTTNTTSSFENHLTPPLSFDDDDFEVGVKEIQYPFTWNNIVSDQYAIIHYASTNENKVFENIIGPILILPKGRYTDLKVIIDMINSALAKAVAVPQGLMPGKRIEAPKIERSTRHFNCLMASPGVYEMRTQKSPTCLFLSKELAEMLGFRSTFFVNSELHAEFLTGLNVVELSKQFKGSLVTTFKSDFTFIPLSAVTSSNVELRSSHNYIVKSGAGGTKPSTTVFATNPPDLSNGLSHLVVMSDVVKHHRVGNQNKQVLLMAPVPSNASFGDTICERFVEPTFYPVCYNTIDKIAIDIRDRTGKLIDFNTGSIVITLHFRLKRR